MEYKVVVNSKGTIWYKLGTDVIHREDGPAIDDSHGYKVWYLNGELHREDGPAVEYSDGYKAWYLNGKQHREDGPAIEYCDGSKAWFLNYKRHREDGPAIENSDGSRYWYLNDKELSEKEFNNRKKDSCNNKIVEIEGKKYQLVLLDK